MRPYEGLLTAMVTPFRADGGVNEAAAVALGRHLLANGSHGLVVCGTTGEGTTMSDEETVGLVGLMAAELGEKAAIVAGAGSNDTRHAAHLTEQVVGAGAHGVLSVTPYYNKPNRRGLVRHFEEVASAAAGCPVILYNIPSRTALALRPPLWQMTNSWPLPSTSSKRSGSVPSGMSSAPGTWPRSYSSGSRTSISRPPDSRCRSSSTTGISLITTVANLPTALVG